MYALWNDTDGVYAAPELFKTRREAQAYARAFRRRFAAQGYYLTADWERIPVSEVRLMLVDVEDISPAS